ncbi:Uncharacterized protein PECH_008608 [Penicillium ucsense]|uniref:Spindle pole body associated protein SnaD n=1 Tax=Penicillium ucsense TaxID=2839758 RepID=A0A8J8WHZ4_9EURO|nr:Uncharacterized protein PECM_005183 [Penicillium ucsense]KAF7738616.1 Uncharacterized protein PECH_008608 [Penicillium ucsense]
MANSGYTSPFPTSHDTIGQSTLVTPLFMPSSPPQQSSLPVTQAPRSPQSPQSAHSPPSPRSPRSPRPPQSPHSPASPQSNQSPRYLQSPRSPLSSLRSPPRPESPVSEKFDPHEDEEDDEEDRLREDNHERGSDRDSDHEDNLQDLSRPSTPGTLNGLGLDARLANYSVDFSAFPSSKFLDDRDGPLLPEPEDEDDARDKLSDVGGPEDFTANMERYLLGEGMSSARRSRFSDHDPLPEPKSRFNGVTGRETAVDDDADAGEISEFGPPVDMSTPSHLLHRTSALPRDSTQLEDIEEDPQDEVSAMASPSERKVSMASDHSTEHLEERLQQRIAELEEEIENRDDQMYKNRTRVKEAASAMDQVRHLQAELQLKNEQLSELATKTENEAKLQARVDALEREKEQREKLSQQTTSNQSDFSAVEQQLRDMQRQLQDKDSPSALDAERLETIAHLRQQLQLTQDQVRKRDESLEETMNKLKEVTKAKEAQLHEKNAEIDRLKGEIDEQALENEKLENELERVNKDYEALEDRLTALEVKSAPLEERNHSLEADLTRAQSQVEAQESALKAVAADLPIGSRNTYSEILDLIKDLGGEDPPPRRVSSPRGKICEADDLTVQEMREEVSRLQQELETTGASQRAAETEASHVKEQLAETQDLVKTIEKENSRLTSRVEELVSHLTKSQQELTRTQKEHAEALESVARLQEAALDQPPSPSPSPPKTQDMRQSEAQYAARVADIEAAHQAQMRSLQTVHSTAVSTLRSSHAESMRKIRSLLSAAEQREAELRTELTTIRTTLNLQEPSLRKSFKSEIRRLEAVIAAKDETSVAIDERIALSVDKREREWERRVDLLLKERDRMAKALMMYWGEKELGKGPGSLAGTKGHRRREGGDVVDAKEGQAYKYLKR